MNEGRLRAEKTRGQQAQSLIENGLLNEVLDKIEAQTLEAWRESDAADHEGRHNAYLMQRLLRNLRGEIRRIAKTGEAASKQLTTIQKEANNG